MNNNYKNVFEEQLNIIEKIKNTIYKNNVNKLFIDGRYFIGEKTSIRITKDENTINIDNVFQIGIRIIYKQNHWLIVGNDGKSILNKLKDKLKSINKITLLNNNIKKYSNKKKTDYESIQINKFNSEKKFNNYEFDYIYKELKTCIKQSIKTIPINSYVAVLNQKEGKLGIFNSYGTDICFPHSETYFRYTAVHKKNNIQESITHVDGSRNGNAEIAMEKIINVAHKDVIELLNAEPCRKGVTDIIIDNKLAGVLAHESVGHASEADAIINNDSVFKEKLNRKIANENVSVYDNPHIGYGTIPYDDEGTKTELVKIIENGVLKNYLHSNETAYKLKMKSTGNARVMNPENIPIVRMRTTYFGPGDVNKNELFCSNKEMLYFVDMSGGSVNPVNGNFVFKPKKAYIIKNGDIIKPVKNAILSGNLLNILMSVELVGNDFLLSCGYCGKLGQLVPVGDGGPHMKINNVLVG